jgi:thiamine pyrophosphate-dependent acetolactate synthase large subunit-like protein
MPLVAALETLRDVRADRVVVASMGSAREWPRLSLHALDFHYVPSTMGGAIPLALGLALARPEREIVVISGDGSLLMNLGSLVTVAASGAANLTIVLLNNAVYEVTGGQATAAAHSAIDFCRVAADCGIRTVRAFADLSLWRGEAAATLTLAGPRFIELCVSAVKDDFRLESPGPMVPRLEAFRRALLC